MVCDADLRVNLCITLLLPLVLPHAQIYSEICITRHPYLVFYAFYVIAIITNTVEPPNKGHDGTKSSFIGRCPLLGG